MAQGSQCGSSARFLAVHQPGRQCGVHYPGPGPGAVARRLHVRLQGRSPERPPVDQAAGRAEPHADQRDGARQQPGVLARRGVGGLRRRRTSQESAGLGRGQRHAGGLGRRRVRGRRLARRRDDRLRAPQSAGDATGQRRRGPEHGRVEQRVLSRLTGRRRRGDAGGAAGRTRRAVSAVRVQLRDHERPRGGFPDRARETAVQRRGPGLVSAQRASLVCPA